jgi:hypothetical protein
MKKPLQRPNCRRSNSLRRRKDAAIHRADKLYARQLTVVQLPSGLRHAVPRPTCGVASI